MTGKSDYQVGKGKPPIHTRFGAGNKANPQGKTAEQKRLEMQNAELAMSIRNRLLTALQGVLNEDPTKETIVSDHITSEILKLLKDSEDRGLGAPIQAVDHTTNGKDMPNGIDLTKAPPELLAWIVEQGDASKPE